jgi:hypothetical protein
MHANTSVNADSDILQTIRAAFASCARPEHFTDYTHCEECREHDELLRNHDLDTLTREAVGHAGWDPICFISPEGFAYYFPALARLALVPPNDQQDWYLPQLLFHLRHNGHHNERFCHCSLEQRSVVAMFLKHVIDTRPKLLDQHCSVEDAKCVLKIWMPTESAGELNAATVR